MADHSGHGTRRSPRRAFKRPIGALIGGAYEVTRAVQISEGGMLIEGKMSLQPQDHLVVTLLLPGGGHVVAAAEIVYVMKADVKRSLPAFGLQFVDLPLPKKRLIRNYVAAKTEEEAENDVDMEEAFRNSGTRAGSSELRPFGGLKTATGQTKKAA